MLEVVAGLSPASFFLVDYAQHNPAQHPHDQEWNDGGQDVVGDDGCDHVADDFILVFMHRQLHLRHSLRNSQPAQVKLGHGT